MSVFGILFWMLHWLLKSSKMIQFPLLLLFHSVPMINTYEFISFKPLFCFANFSAPFNRTKMVLYSKWPYGSQFSGEKNDLKIRSLVAEILSKNPVLFFLGHPVVINLLYMAGEPKCCLLSTATYLVLARGSTDDPISSV